MTPSLFTIGHSNHSFERFAELLRGAAVDTVIDVRSQPMSRWVPHFNRSALEHALPAHSIAYLFLGQELGGRPHDPKLVRQGKPDYTAMAQAQAFKDAIDRIIEMAKTSRAALMCAERDPLDCHRFLLIARELAKRGQPVTHILADGALEGQEATEQRSAASLHPRLI